MPIIKSARKRVKVSAKASVRNAKTKRTMREALKAFTTALQSGKSAEIVKAQSEATSAIDIALKKNIIHKNKASRQKAKLSAQAKSAGAKVAKTTTKKPVAKKPAPKKPAVKKPAAKKAK